MNNADQKQNKLSHLLVTVYFTSIFFKTALQIFTSANEMYP